MKKTLSLLLCIILASVMTAGAAFAQESDEEVNPAQAAQAQEGEAEEAPMLNPEEAAAQEEAQYASPFEAAMAGENLIKTEAPLSEEGEVTVEDYSVIEIPENLVEVSDQDVENEINNMLSFATTSEQITEGTVESGDTVNIDFAGVIEGETEPFEGGSAQGYDIVLGSGTFIPGFEDQIVGHEIGETFDIQVTFPEEFSEDLAGKNVTFTVTINYKTVQVTPELNDEFVRSFAAANFNTELNTVDELREYVREYLYNNLLDNAIMKALQEKTTVTSYEESVFEMLSEYYLADLAKYAEMYAAYGMEGYDADMIAKLSGFADAQSYAADEAMYYLDAVMALDTVAKDLGIEVTDEEVDEAILATMKSYGYDTVYTVDEFRELNGEGWTFLMTKLNVEYGKVVKALRDNVVFTEPVPEEEGDSPVIEVQNPDQEIAE